MAKIIQFSFLLLMLTASLQGQQRQAAALSDSERNKLANIVISKWNFEGEESVFLASENLPASFSLFRVNRDIPIKLITGEEIKKKEGKFIYYAFTPLVVNKGIVIVNLKKITLYPQDFNSVGLKYKCRKVRKSWQCSASGWTMEQT
jgi:hypothetical protein